MDNVTKGFYIYTLKPPRDNFSDNKTAHEELIIEMHFNYLKELLDEGTLIMAARTNDAKFGIVIFEADSEDQAKKIMENDPAVMNKVFTADLNSLRISLFKT